jgi:hypothetical protein
VLTGVSSRADAAMWQPTTDLIVADLPELAAHWDG